MRVKDIGGVLVREDGMVKNITGHSKAIKDWHTGSNKGGYFTVRVPGKGMQLVHRLVAKAFIPNPDKKPYINHINGVRNDNRVCNLEWCTASENIQHAYDTGLQKSGKDHYTNKLTVEDYIVIKQHLSEGKLSQTKIAELYGVSLITINRINRGDHWSCK